MQSKSERPGLNKAMPASGALMLVLGWPFVQIGMPRDDQFVKVHVLFHSISGPKESRFRWKETKTLSASTRSILPYQICF